MIHRRGDLSAKNEINIHSRTVFIVLASGDLYNRLDADLIREPLPKIVSGF